MQHRRIYADGPDSTELRPETALELLRGSVVRTGGVVHLLTTPTDASCRGVTLLCRRASEFVIPAFAPASGGSGSSANIKDKPGSGRPRNAARNRVRGEEGRLNIGERRGERARGGKEEDLSSNEKDWASLLFEWGVVTTRSEVIVPHKALEVWYHDTSLETSSEGMQLL